MTYNVFGETLNLAQSINVHLRANASRFNCITFSDSFSVCLQLWTGDMEFKQPCLEFTGSQTLPRQQHQQIINHDDAATMQYSLLSQKFRDV